MMNSLFALSLTLLLSADNAADNAPPPSTDDQPVMPLGPTARPDPDAPPAAEPKAPDKKAPPPAAKPAPAPPPAAKPAPTPPPATKSAPLAPPPGAADETSPGAELESPVDLPAPGAAPPPEEPAPPPEEPAPPPEEPPTHNLPEKTKARLIVLDLADQGAGPELVTALSQAMQQQARQSFPGETMALDQLRLAVSAAEIQAAMGCTAPECMIAFGQSVEADLVLGGSVSKVGDDVLISVLTVKPGTGENVASLQRKVPTFKDLSYYAVRDMTSRVLTGLAVDDRVPVRITASDSDAGLFIDGAPAGSLPTVIKLAPGRHELEVQASNKAPWRTTLNVEEGQPLDVHAELALGHFPLWTVGMALGGVGVLFAAAWAGMALYTLEAYNGGTGVFSTVGVVQKNSDYWHITPADTALLSEKRTQVQLLAAGTDFLAGGALFFTALAISVHVADVVWLALE